MSYEENYSHDSMNTFDVVEYVRVIEDCRQNYIWIRVKCNNNQSSLKIKRFRFIAFV